MKRLMFSTILAVAAIAMACIAPMAGAGEDRPFKATTEVTLVSGDGQGNFVYSGSANATHMGICVVQVVVSIDPTREAATGTVTLTHGDADSVTLQFDQTWDAANGYWVGVYTITGGTGRFQGAGGSGTLVNRAGDVPGTRVGEYTGTISY